MGIGSRAAGGHNTSVHISHCILPDMYPGVFYSLGHGTVHSLAPGSAHSLAPGRAHSLAPGRIHSLAPGSTHSLPPGSIHSLPHSHALSTARASIHITRCTGSKQDCDGRGGQKSCPVPHHKHVSFSSC